MKKVSLFLGICLMAIVVVFQSCSKEEGIIDSSKEEISLDKLNYFSKKDIQAIQHWFNSQDITDNGKLNSSSFPKLEFTPSPSNTDPELIKEYIDKILDVTNAIVNGAALNYSYNDLIKQIKSDDLLDENAKSIILSNIQLSNEVFASDLSKKKLVIGGGVLTGGGPSCDCSVTRTAYLFYSDLCQRFGNFFGHCDNEIRAYLDYKECLKKELHCPGGFIYDGVNCYSGIHIPSGYTGFIYGSSFYIEPNCGISTANNCCPNGYNYDGVNCYSGVHFPEGYRPFIYDNAFYVEPQCY